MDGSTRASFEFYQYLEFWVMHELLGQRPFFKSPLTANQILVRLRELEIEKIMCSSSDVAAVLEILIAKRSIVAIEDKYYPIVVQVSCWSTPFNSYIHPSKAS